MPKLICLDVIINLNNYLPLSYPLRIKWLFFSFAHFNSFNISKINSHIAFNILKNNNYFPLILSLTLITHSPVYFLRVYQFIFIFYILVFHPVFAVHIGAPTKFGSHIAESIRG